MEKVKYISNYIEIIFLSSLIFICVQIQIVGQSMDFLVGNQNKGDATDLNTISVTLGGDFVVNGTFIAAGTETVDQFVTRIFSEYSNRILKRTTEQNLFKIIKSELNNYSKRGILLKRYDGSQITVDLEKFRLTGDFKFNPYLKNNDVLIFPVLDLERNFIDISGAVNKAKKFQFVEGDRLSDAILLANGINPAYSNVEYAEIYRLDEKGNEQTVERVLIKDNPYLKRGDRIRILAGENQKKDYKVLVLGEVKQPGYVYIAKNGMDIKDVIKLSGGFTSSASLERSTVLRGTNKENLLLIKAFTELYKDSKNIDIKKFNENNFLSQFEYLSFMRMSDEVLEDSLYFLIDMKLKQFFDYGAVDFTKVFAGKDSLSVSFRVKDGDVILIPQQSNDVFVFGQVNSPGYIPFKKGKNFHYYINHAGGLGEDYLDNIKVIRGKAKTWITAEESTEILPGDYIYVPKDPSRSFLYYLRTASYITSIASALATVAILILNLTK